jgi:hypothetical protein
MRPKYGVGVIGFDSQSGVPAIGLALRQPVEPDIPAQLRWTTPEVK